MPGVTLHFLTADRILHRWRVGTDRAPFDLDDPVALNAFYHGAVGPDLGYFPGGHRALSDLAHCLRTGVLARAIVRAAGTVRERAFAWGWLTHFLADGAIHPCIGHGVGELLTGDRANFVDGSTNLLAHLRIEMGVDAWYADRAPGVRRRRLGTAFGPGEMGFLIRAYASTYGVAIAAEHFERSHRCATRRVGQALASLRLISALMRGGAAPILPTVRWALRTAYHSGPLRSAPLAYLNPVLPRPWLVEAVDGALADLTGAFMDHYRSGAAHVPDVNLDTGRLLAGEENHVGTRRALEVLQTLPAWPSRATGALEPKPLPVGGLISRDRPLEA